MMNEQLQCECHECTQARYRQSFRYQLDQVMNPIKPPVEAPKQEESAYLRVTKAMGAVTLSREEGDKILEYVKGAIHGNDKPRAPKKDIDGFMANGYPSSDSDGNWLCHVCGQRINHLGTCDHHTPETQGTDGSDVIDVVNKRMSDYTQWIWENLDRAATGKILLPRLEWDKPRMKIFSYADLVNFRSGAKK